MSEQWHIQRRPTFFFVVVFLRKRKRTSKIINRLLFFCGFKNKKIEEETGFPENVSKGGKNPSGEAPVCLPAKEGDKYERYTRQVEQVAALVSPYIVRVHTHRESRRLQAHGLGHSALYVLLTHTHTHPPPLLYVTLGVCNTWHEHSRMSSLHSRPEAFRCDCCDLSFRLY